MIDYVEHLFARGTHPIAVVRLQARETNARLERAGFKLDTKEEETARLSDALGSFSYDTAGSGKKSKPTKTDNSERKKK